MVPELLSEDLYSPDKPSEGHLCVKCHMPGRVYMGADSRLDRSLRVPRPDLGAALDAPNTGMRYTAIRSLEYFDADTRLTRIAPKLYDPVKAVRMEAAILLSVPPRERLRPDDREAFRTALAEYRDAVRSNADFAPQRHNLGNLALHEGNAAAAAADYEKAIAIDARFYPAKVNLASLYNKQGRNRDAERLLKETLAENPDLREAASSLGLLLAELGDSREAERCLGAASARPRNRPGTVANRMRRDDTAPGCGRAFPPSGRGQDGHLPGCRAWRTAWAHS
jgi:tetratricopeptide (TPR) repeat protein